MTLRPDSRADGAVARQAGAALVQDPTAVEGLIVLGLQAQLRGDVRTSDQAFSLARRLSLRETKLSVWRIEKAVSNGDIDTALAEYDLALSTNKSSHDILFPVLARAIAEPVIAKRLAAKFSDEAGWHASFIEYVSDNFTNPSATVAFFRDLDRTGVSMDANVADLVNGLVEKGFVDEARTLYLNGRKENPQNLVSNAGFSPDIRYPTVFDWSTAASSGLRSNLSRDGSAAYLTFDIAPGSSGTVVQQLLTLTPGTYEISGRVDGIDRRAANRLYWTFRCLNGLEIGQVTLADNWSRSGSFSGTATLPGNCPAQNFALVARGSGGAGSVNGRILNVAVTRARR